MALYAIGDLHLSGQSDKPMDIFGEHWVLHHKKIEENWRNIVNEDDTILIPGDISWAMTLEEAREDLKWIDSLPGNKVLIRGNHDYWWGSISKLNTLFDRMLFLQNSFAGYKEYAIGGTRGWLCPNKVKFTEHDEKIYNREAHRLELSLKAATRQGYSKIIVMLHYPPTNDSHDSSLFTEIMESYGVEQVIYGHLHGDDSYDSGLQGYRNGVLYKLVSCDYLNFDLAKIL